MKKWSLFSILVLSITTTSHASPNWSEQAHWDLIQAAFQGDRGDCLFKMKAGSEWVDSLPNQVPSKSYLHAMRSGADQPIAQARAWMADFIRTQYELASDARDRGTQVIYATPADPTAQITTDGRLITDLGQYLESCYRRGVALHPAMDSTSPAHADFAIWSLTDIAGIFQHGNLPGSLENERALLSNPDLMKKTVGLMRLIDKVYLEFGMKDFRFDQTGGEP